MSPKAKRNGGPDTAGQLAGNPKNPRRSSDLRREELGRSMREFGDIGAIVFNRRTGRLVGGHQRREQLPAGAKIRRMQSFEPPSAAGTVALGTIEMEGEAFLYREVDWPEEKELAANIRANNPAGEWDELMLARLLEEIGQLGGDQSLTGFSSQAIDALLASVQSQTPSGPNLAERFGVPPFSILDARQGYWQERKQRWLEIGIRSELGRGENLLRFSDAMLTAQAGGDPYAGKRRG